MAGKDHCTSQEKWDLGNDGRLTNAQPDAKLGMGPVDHLLPGGTKIPLFNNKEQQPPNGDKTSTDFEKWGGAW